MNCEVCNTGFDIQSKPSKKYCSKICANKANQLRNPQRTTNPFNVSKATMGALGELVASADLLRRGYEVFRALSPACSCDLLAMKDGKLLRIEVRTGFRNRSDGRLSFSKNHFNADVYAVVVGSEVLYEPEL